LALAGAATQSDAASTKSRASRTMWAAYAQPGDALDSLHKYGSSSRRVPVHRVEAHG
jgi:hypothetical protein